jgi:branched-chain amino acid aminotransferase
MKDLSADRGFLLGDGVFDTLVAFNGVPVEGERHLARLVDQAAQIGISVDVAEIRQEWTETLPASGNAGYILRTTVTRGSSERGLWPESKSAPTLSIRIAPWSPPLLQGRVSLATGTIRRNEQSPTSRLKSLSYLDNVLAAREAQERDADDALLLNTAGAVACTTIANVFAIRGSRLLTPPLADGVLAGIVRGLVLDLAPAVGLEPREIRMAPADLAAADFAFITNSVRFLRPLAALDGRRFPDALPESFLALRRAIAARVAEATGFTLAWD